MIRKEYWIAAFAVAGLILGWGCFSWLTAYLYQPVSPPLAPLQQYSYIKPEIAFPLVRYQPLLNGSMFFGPVPVETVQFNSRLVLLGLIKGTSNRALVGLAPEAGQQTQIVKLGDTFEGERIVTIGFDHITVRNATGEGQIFLSD